MNNLRITCLGILFAGAAGLSTNVSANTVKYEGHYVMGDECQFTVTAGMGFVTMAVSTSEDEVNAEGVDNLVEETFSYTCDGLIIDDSEVLVYQQSVSDVCSGFVIPGVSQTQRDEYCDQLGADAVHFLSEAADYALRDMVDSVSLNIVNDYWVGGLGEMDYLFTDGTTDHRGPSVFVSNAGRYYRGYAEDGDLPNPSEVFCKAQILGKMDTDIDLSSAFGGGARMHLDTNIIDGVACPVITTDAELLVVGYGYVINIQQQGDRQ